MERRGDERSAFFVDGLPAAEDGDLVLDGPDDVADYGEDDEEDDDYDCYCYVACDHFEWGGSG